MGENTEVDLYLSEKFEAYLTRIFSEERDSSIELERDAFEKMIACIKREKNPYIREFMRDTMLWLCEGYMLFTYYMDCCWSQEVKDRRRMLKTMPPIDLYVELEKILASQMDSEGYTKNAYSPRYPLIIPRHHHIRTEKVRNIDSATISPLRLYMSYYKFGVHTYYAGHAIKGLLECIESRYGLNFQDLERLYKKSQGHRT